jgi:excinuclease ABC subunit B
MGRAARHLEGHVIMYADRITASMQRARSETKRRRKTQETYNKAHGITPQTIIKAIRESRLAGKKLEEQNASPNLDINLIPKEEIPYLLKDLEQQMEISAQNLQFEKAAALRDQIKLIKGDRPATKIKISRKRHK